MDIMGSRVFVTAGVRTPIGKYLGCLRTVSSQELAAAVIRESLHRAGLEDVGVVDEVILGEVEASGEAPNVARVAALLCGMEGVPGYSVNRMCGSGMQAIANGFMQIQRGQDGVVVGGGTESMSRATYYLPPEARYEGLRMGNKTLLDTNTTVHCNAAPHDIWHIDHMGNTAETVARRLEISREDCDWLAWDSQMKCRRATESGRLGREITPIEVVGRRGRVTVVDRDEFPRPDTTLEGLAGLRPAFEKDGVVTAGNASGVNDAAAAVLLASDRRVGELGLSPMAEIVDFAVVGLDPSVMGLGPVYAIRKLLERVGMAMGNIDVFEINEAFAPQILGCLKELDMYPGSEMYERVNPNGGAIALGHALGCTGARLVESAAHELAESGKEYAIASACMAGGMGIAMLLRNASR